MKKILSMVLILMLLAGAACAEQTLVIGGTGPLTGDYATYGVSARNGAIIAMNEINAAGGVNGILFDVEYEDDETDPEKAVNGYSVLIDKGMKVSLGAVTSGACCALIEESLYDGILVITPSASQKECVQYDNCFRICFTDPDQGVYAADFIADHNVAQTVAIIYDKSNDYSVGLHDNFVDEAAQRGIDVLTDQAFTNQSNTDFSVQIQAIADSGAELVFLPIYAQEAAYILTQSEAAGLDVIFFGCDGMDGIQQKIGEDHLSACEGLMMLTPFAADATDDKTVSFVTAYQDAYGAIPDQFAADGYDAVYAIKAAIEQAGITDIECDDFNDLMIAAMTQITVDGLTGHMTWTEDGECAKNATAVVITDGVYVAYAD